MLPYQPEEIATQIHRENLRIAEHARLVRLARGPRPRHVVLRATNRFWEWITSLNRDWFFMRQSPIMQECACAEC
jgi:hypothetical protein